MDCLHPNLSVRTWRAEKLGIGDCFPIVKHNLLPRKNLFFHAFFNFLSKSLQTDIATINKGKILGHYL